MNYIKHIVYLFTYPAFSRSWISVRLRWLDLLLDLLSFGLYILMIVSPLKNFLLLLSAYCMAAKNIFELWLLTFLGSMELSHQT